MQKRLRLFWGLILLLSIAWILVGAFITSDAYVQGNVGDDLSAEIEAMAAEVDVPFPADWPLPLLFIATGLPLALISLYFVWRNNRAVAAHAVAHPDQRLRRQTVTITVLALVFALLLWNIRDVERILGFNGAEAGGLSMTAITYPVRLFVTFIHEAGHSVAALISGGQVFGFTVSPDGSGSAITGNGNRALVLPAGYLGAALFGSMLFFLTNRIPIWTRGLSFLIGLSIIGLTLSYAMPDQSGNVTALIVGIVFGIALMALGWAAPRVLNVFILNTLAILTGLNAVFDLWSLVGNSDIGSGSRINDAAAFSQEITPLLPPAVVAFLWAAVAIGMSGLALYFGLIKQVESEISDAVTSKTAQVDPNLAFKRKQK